jgi:hypothetical protein
MDIVASMNANRSPSSRSARLSIIQMDMAFEWVLSFCAAGPVKGAYITYAINAGVGIEELTALTSKERILLYLSDFSRMEDRYELPAGLTQESIAASTRIQRKHLPQYLKDLVDDGLVVQRKAHIQGMKQRMNGYYLGPSGSAKATDLRDRLAGVTVDVTVNGATKVMRVDEVDESTSFHITFCDIVCEALHEGSLDMSSLERIEARKRSKMESSDRATEIYKRALKTAWRDGKVTATERFLIEELRTHLKISSDLHKELEREIIKKVAQDHMEFIRIYRTILEIGLGDGTLDGPEVEILDALRKMLRITMREHEELLREAETSVCGPKDELLQATDER